MNKQSLSDAIARFAIESPLQTALQGSDTSISYAELAIAIGQIKQRFAYSVSKVFGSTSSMVMGIAMDNCPAWAIADLAAMQLNLPVVPLPHFFSTEQIVHAIDNANINVILTDNPELFKSLFTDTQVSNKQASSNKKILK